MPFFIHTSVSTNGFLYVLGGGGGPHVFYAKVEPEGKLGAWQRATSLPPDAAHNYMRAVVWRKWLYAVGGTARQKKDCGTIVYAEIKPDGALGEWQRAALPPRRLRCGAALQTGDRLYYAGGFYERRVCFAPLQPGGDVGEWRETQHLISPRSGLDTFAWQGAIYAVGGNAGHLPDTAKNTVFRTRVRDDGTLERWRRVASLPVATAGFAGAQAEDCLFVLGGTTPSGRTTATWMTRIDAKGKLPKWRPQPPLPQPVDSAAAAPGGNGWIYLTGGFATNPDGARAVSNQVLSARLNP